MNKKGQGLSLNMVVVAVIVLVVLFVVIAFFSGGFTAIAEKVGNIFKGGIDDRAVSIQLCNTYCLSSKRLDVDQMKDSKFCTARFSVDSDGDNKISEGEKDKTTCGGTGQYGLNVKCEVTRIGGIKQDIPC